MGKKLKIFGSEYEVKSELPSIYIDEIAEYVDSKFRELSTSHRSLLEVAVLGALNIADELFQERELNRKNTEIVRRTVELLDRALLQSSRFPGVSVMGSES